MMVPTCSRPDSTLSKTIAFRYIHGPGLILSTLAQCRFAIQELTPVDHPARRETSRHPQLKILQTWELRRHACRCCRTLDPANQGVTVSTLRPGSDPVNLTFLIRVHRLNPLTSLLEACDGSVGSNGTGNSNNRKIGSCPSKLEGGDDFGLEITRCRISFG